MGDLTEDQIEDLQDVYALLSKENGLAVEDLGKALRMLDQTPSESEVKNFINTLDQEVNTVDYEDFVSIFKTCSESCRIDFTEVKSQLDKLEKNEEGFVKTKDLKDLLINGEEPLDILEAEELLKDFDKEGRVDIELFYAALTA